MSFKFVIGSRVEVSYQGATFPGTVTALPETDPKGLHRYFVRCDDDPVDVVTACQYSALKPLSTFQKSEDNQPTTNSTACGYGGGAPPAQPTQTDTARDQEGTGKSAKRASKVQAFMVGSQKFVATSPSNALKEAMQQEQMARSRTLRRKTLGELDQKSKHCHERLRMAVRTKADFWAIALPMTNFQMFDSNGDGKIDKKELETLCAAVLKQLKLEDAGKQIALELFDRYDEDKSGFIEPNEFPELYYRLIKNLLGKFSYVDQKRLPQAATGNFYDHYEIVRRLNQGQQGVTYIVKQKCTGANFVAKKPLQNTDLSDFEAIRDKAHANVVKVFELFAMKHETMVIMEFCEGGDLWAAIAHCFRTFKMISVKFCASALEQTMVGVRYLHEQFRQCHNDIKPENVLLDHKPTGLGDIPRFMIADFGCASGLGENRNGDPRYNAPELWLGAPVSYKSDVWALGVTMYELLSGGILIFTEQRNISGWGAWRLHANGELFQTFRKAIETPGAEPNWARIHQFGPAALQLCKKMLAWEFDDRISIRDALQNGWFKEKLGDEPLHHDISESLVKRSELSRWKMMLLNMVASKLQGESIEHYRAMWNKADSDQNGSLTQREFVTLLAKNYINVHDAADLFAAADVDGSGEIDFNEFVAIFFDANAMSPADLRTHCLHMFSSLSQGEELTAEQFAAEFPAHHLHEITDLFREIDTDKNGSISLDEFTEFLSKM